MNRKYTLAQFDGIVAIDPAPSAGVRHHDRFNRRLSGRNGERLPSRRSITCVRGVFANAFSFIYSIRRGTPTARWAQVPRALALERFAELIEAQNSVTRAYHDSHVGRTVRVLIGGDSKKDASRLTAKALDNVTVVARKPADYPYPQTPWVDVAIETAHVWGCTGTVCGGPSVLPMRECRLCGPCSI